MADLAKLVVRLEAQTAQYQAQLERAQKQLTRFESVGSKAIKTLAGVVAGVSFANLISGSLTAAARLGDLAKQTGIAVEDLSRLQYAARQNGSDLDTLATGLRQLASNAVDAAGGAEAQAYAFQALGISVEDANGQIRPTNDLLLEIAEKFRGFEDGATKSALAGDLFGKKIGPELIPLLNQGRDGITTLAEEADRLGLTLSGSAAASADQFNAAIDRGKQQVESFLANALAPLLPVLTDSINAFTGSANGAYAMEFAARTLQAGVKGLVTIGMGVVFTFKEIGKTLGALAAVAVAVANGDFKRAADIVKNRGSDFVESSRDALTAMEKLWSDTGQQIVGEAKRADVELRKTLIYNPAGQGSKGGGKAKSRDDIGEVVVTAARTRVSAMQSMYESLDQLTQTSTERQLAQFAEIESALNELQAAGRITAEQYAARYNEALDALLSEVNVTAEKVGDRYLKQYDKVNEYQKALAQNTVDIIADTLREGFKGGVDDILVRFRDMLLELAIQAQAARIGEMIFGTNPGKGGGGSGFLGGIGSFLSGLFGPGRARGGPVSPGTLYPVNENTPNTEYFMPSVPGTIIPAEKVGGGMVVNQTFHITAPNGTLPRATQQQIAAQASRGLSAANRRNN